MQMRAGIIAIVLTSVVVWLLSGLFYMVLVKDMMMAAQVPFKSVMWTEAEMPSPVWWLVPLLLMSWLLLRILTQTGGPIATGRGAMWGVTMAVVVAVVQTIGWCMMFQSYDIQFTAITIAWEAVQWGIGGAVMAVIYSKLYKA